MNLSTNPENVRKRAHYAENRKRIRASQAVHYAANSKKIIAKSLAYKNARRRSDPDFRVTTNLRVRVYDAIQGKKCAGTRELLGCTLPELRSHLESQFRPGMTWENYGPVWHIDHRRPCASFDLLDPAQQRVCFHYTNLQPLFAEENLKKGPR